MRTSSNIAITLGTLLLLNWAPVAHSQRENLPQGLGVYSLGYRAFEKQTETYNSQGTLEAIGKPFTKDFNGQNLLEGGGGDALKELANEIRKFDGNSDAPDSLLNSLKLGNLKTDVEADLSVKALGIGYGVNKWLTTFIMVPWVDVDVNVDINFEGDDNVDEIRARLGELAFEKLKDGLVQAQQIDTQQIIDGMTNLGYKDPRKWSYHGVGDLQMGTSLTGIRNPLRLVKAMQTLRTTLSMPTGHYDDPDILTDVSVGRGYYLLTNKYIQKFIIANSLYFGGDLSYGYGQVSKVKKRVPVSDESLVAKDRTSKVSLTPGADVGYGALAGYNIWILKFRYYVGAKRHYRDRYKGSLDGNYKKLAERSDKFQSFQEPSIAIQTIDAYKHGQFFVPLIATLKAHIPIKAKNSINERYYEVSLASFFTTPYSSTSKKATRKKTRKKRTRKYATKNKSKSKKKPYISSFAH